MSNFSTQLLLLDTLQCCYSFVVTVSCKTLIFNPWQVSTGCTVILLSGNKIKSCSLHWTVYVIDSQTNIIMMINWKLPLNYHQCYLYQMSSLWFDVRTNTQVDKSNYLATWTGQLSRYVNKEVILILNS